MAEYVWAKMLKTLESRVYMQVGPWEHLPSAAVALVRWDLKGSQQQRRSRRAGKSDGKEVREETGWEVDSDAVI